MTNLSTSNSRTGNLISNLQIDTPENQLLLGREVVFDKFNIEFRQADEQLILTWRDDNN